MPVSSSVNKNPKLLVTDYYDYLIRLVDIHTEDKLAAALDDHHESLIISSNSHSHSSVDDVHDDFRLRPARDKRVDTFGIDAYIDPYRCGVDPSPPQIPTELNNLTISDYLNTVRENMIDELVRAQNESLKTCDDRLVKFRDEFKHNESKIDRDKLWAHVFANKFCFLFRREEIVWPKPVVRFPSEMFLFVLDFYLDSEEQEILRYFRSQVI